MSNINNKIDLKTNELKDYSTADAVQPTKEYDPNVDYMARIQQNIKDGDYDSAAENERLRNLKIAGTGSSQTPTDMFKYQDSKTATVAQPLKGYDPNVDYMASMKQKIMNGDFTGAAEDERLRNLKIEDTGSSYSPTNWFNYQDGTQYARENLLNDIKDYNKKGFTYNPENDAVYQSLDKRYKQQALDDYNSNLSSLAAQYGGEIPAYLRQIAKNSYQTDAGRANDAIPTLSQMAWDKWADTRNDMYNQYALLDNQETKDYNKFVDTRNFITGASDNMYNRSVTDKNLDMQQQQIDITRDTNNKQIALSNAQLALQRDQFNTGVMFDNGTALLNLAGYFVDMGLSWDAALQKAEQNFAKIYGGGT